MKGLIIVGVIMAIYLILTLIFYCHATEKEKIKNMTKKERKEYFRAKREREDRCIKWLLIWNLFRPRF